MSREAMKHTPGPWFSQYDDNGFYEIGSEAVSLRQALETEQKTAVSPGKGTGFNYFRAIETKLREKNHG